jgi:hypothetical protein
MSAPCRKNVPGAEVDVVGVFVHVQHQERRSHDRVVHVIPGPVVVGFARVQVEGEDDPAGAAGQGVRGALELGLPRLLAAEGALDQVEGAPGGLPVATQVGEVVLVQHDRARADELLALQVAVDEGRQLLVLEHGVEPLLHGVQRLYRAAVVVLPVRPHQLLRKPLELRGMSSGERAAPAPSRIPSSADR